MVGTKPTVDPATVDAVRVWLSDESHRFLSVDDHGRLTVRLDMLAELVAEIVTEHTTDLQSELDAAQDALNDMERELSHPTVYESADDFLAHLDELRGDAVGDR